MTVVAEMIVAAMVAVAVIVAVAVTVAVSVALATVSRVLSVGWQTVRGGKNEEEPA